MLQWKTSLLALAFLAVCNACGEATADGLYPSFTIAVETESGVQPYNTSTSNVDEDITTVIFNASSSSADSEIINFTWDFGNSNTATGEVVSHIFANPGDFSVQLTVTYSNSSSDTLTTTIQVHDITAPLAQFNWSYINDTGAVIIGAAMEGKTVHFNASGTDDNSDGPLTYIWDFGDGTNGTGVYVDHNFNDPREAGFDVILSVTDSSGNTDLVVRSIVLAFIQTDLSMETLLFSDETPLEGDIIELTAFFSVRALPESTNNITITFILDYFDEDNSSIGSVMIDVNNASEFSVTVLWTACCASSNVIGHHTIFVFIDSGNVIDEGQNENNNIRGFNIIVRPIDEESSLPSLSVVVPLFMLVLASIMRRRR